MTESYDKACYIKKLEFLILLAFSGVERVFSFDLPAEEEVADETVISTVCDLVKDGRMKAEERGLVLSDEMKTMADGIRGAQFALNMVLREEAGPQRICYLAEPVILTELTAQEGELRLRAMGQEEFVSWFPRSGVLPPMGVDTEEEGLRMERYNPSIQAERENLSAQDFPPLDAPLNRWIERENVWSAVELNDLREQRAVCRFVFLEGRLNFWLYVQDSEKRRLCLDSADTRRELSEWIASVHSLRAADGSGGAAFCGEKRGEQAV